MAGLRGTVVPILPVEDLDRAVAFYRGIGLEVEALPDVGYAFVGSGGMQFQLSVTDGFDPFTHAASAYLYVDDADAAHQRLSAGLPLGVGRDQLVERRARGESLARCEPVRDEPWGTREFALFDPDNNLLRVGHPLPGVQATELTDTDLAHLRRCVELARDALHTDNDPFGSLLVDGAGVVRFEDRNRTSGGDQTRHPEFEIARWSAAHLSEEERAAATVYTSGEHCPMCAAAHAWAGLGRVVYASSSAQLTQWRSEWQLEPGPVAPLPISAVAPGIPTVGPAPELSDEIRELHRQRAEGHTP